MNSYSFGKPNIDLFGLHEVLLQIVGCNALPTLICSWCSYDVGIHYEAMDGNLVRKYHNMKMTILLVGALQPIIGPFSSSDATSLFREFAPIVPKCKVPIFHCSVIHRLYKFLQFPYCYTSKLIISMMTYCRHYKFRKFHILATSVASVTDIIQSSCPCRVSNDITRNTWRHPHRLVKEEEIIWWRVQIFYHEKNHLKWILKASAPLPNVRECQHSLTFFGGVFQHSVQPSGGALGFFREILGITSLITVRECQWSLPLFGGALQHFVPHSDGALGCFRRSWVVEENQGKIPLISRVGWIRIWDQGWILGRIHNWWIKILNLSQESLRSLGLSKII